MSPNATGALRIPWPATRSAPSEPTRAEADEALARRAAAGDGAAFARLYDRYERRAYSLCYRITGSAEDAADATQETFVAVLERLPRLEGRDLNFGAYVMTAARNASYDAIARRKRAVPSGDIPESAVPVLAGGDDPDGPERHALRAAHQEQIRAANESLPPRQREVLALRELEELSYDEVAEIMGMNRNSVAQLISRARINLRDGLRQTALGSVAAASPHCERALPLLAMHQDGVLEADAGWLAEHLVGCGTCRVRVDAMEEAGVAYRMWVPLVPALWLRNESIAHAAERVGADWSEHVQAPRPRGRHLRLVAAGGAVLSLAFVLAAADLAQSPTRVPAPPAPEPTAAPVEVAAAPRDVAPKAFETTERRASERRAVEKTTVRAVADAPAAAAPTAHPRTATTAAPAPAPARRGPAQRRRQAPPPSVADAPAADPVVAETSPEPAVEIEEPAPEPPDALCPGPSCPSGGTVTTPPCTGSACPPPKPPPVVTCTSCGSVVVNPPPPRERKVTAGPGTP